MTDHERLLNDTWKKMLRRCLNKGDPGYQWYGAKGISVCERWLSRENFTQDMGPRPDGHSLDRIDSTKDYCPENCRWATHVEQQNNRTNNRRLTYNDQTLTFSQWSTVTGIKQKTIRYRYLKGWPIEKVLHDALYRKKRKLTAECGEKE